MEIAPAVGGGLVGGGGPGLRSSGNRLFPVFLKLEGRKVVLVGGGALACAKLAGLLRAGARVTVVAPEARSEIRSPGVIVVQRSFVPSDLDEAWLVVAAASAEVNREVAAAAEERRIFVIAVDDPDHASAYTGGVVRRGGVTIAVSTEGRAPALAGLLREGIEALVPEEEEIGAWVVAARRLRQRHAALGAAPVEADHAAAPGPIVIGEVVAVGAALAAALSTPPSTLAARWALSGGSDGHRRRPQDTRPDTALLRRRDRDR